MNKIILQLCSAFYSPAPARLIRRFSQPASPSVLLAGSLSRTSPRLRFTLWANLQVPLCPDRAKSHFFLNPSTFLLLTSAFLLTACSTPRKYPAPISSGYVPESLAASGEAPKRAVTTNTPARTSTLVAKDSYYQNGKLKSTEVVNKSEYKKGELIKHESVERKIIDTRESVK